MFREGECGEGGCNRFLGFEEGGGVVYCEALVGNDVGEFF